MRAMVMTAVVSLVGLVLASPAVAQSGEESYLEECAGCHGVDGEGGPWGPPITDDGPAGAHFWMATGRMPIRSPSDPILRREPVLSADQIVAITAYVDRISDGPDVPRIAPASGNLQAGSDLYLLHCAACHGSTGVGGAIVGPSNAPDLYRVGPQLVAEAIRSGPGAMPIFDEGTLSDAELDSVVRYVGFLQQREAPGGWRLGRWGPVAEGAVAWLLGIGVVVAGAYWTEGRRRGDEAP